MASRIIVSFTSYPARIKTVSKVLDSIISQTIVPDEILLFLSSDQFSGYGSLPDFSFYEKFGFEVCWQEEDLKSHKKYYYVMQRYPDDIIITVDDDICYSNTMIEELLYYHGKYPRAVITRRAHLVTWMRDGGIASYAKWYMECLRYIGIPRMDLIATGVGGVLYPPHVFKEEIFNKHIFMEKAPYADDLWLKVMELYSGVPVVLAKQLFEDTGLEDYARNGLYSNYNADGGNDIQLQALLKTYGNSCGEENFLLGRLAQEGKLMQDECDCIKREDRWRILDEYFKIVDDEKKVLIYGAGMIAGKIYRIFEKTGRAEKIYAFIVNCVEDNCPELGGIGVRSYRDFVNSSEKIIVGLSGEKQEEVYKDLIIKGIDKKRVIKLNPAINKIIAEI